MVVPWPDPHPNPGPLGMARMPHHRHQNRPRLGPHGPPQAEGIQRLWKLRLSPIAWSRWTPNWAHSSTHSPQHRYELCVDRPRGPRKGGAPPCLPALSPTSLYIDGRFSPCRISDRKIGARTPPLCSAPPKPRPVLPTPGTRPATHPLHRAILLGRHRPTTVKHAKDEQDGFINVPGTTTKHGSIPPN